MLGPAAGLCVAFGGGHSREAIRVYISGFRFQKGIFLPPIITKCFENETLAGLKGT